MDFSTRTLSLIALVAIGLSLLALVFAIAGSGGRRRTKEPSGPIPMDDALRAVLEGTRRRSNASSRPRACSTAPTRSSRS